MSDKYLRRDADNFLNGIGVEQCWGWSPSIDLLSLLDSNVHTDSNETRGNDVHILLVGAADVRHVIHTMAKMRRSDRSASRTVHFHIYEPNLRVHCRHLFFLHLLCDQLSLRELEDRTSMFLELYGNTLIRESTAAVAKVTAAKCVRALSDEQGPLVQYLDFSRLKSKERDFIEEQLRFWTKDASSFKVTEQWNRRLREEMAERYDNKDNIIDWDYQFKLFDYTNMLKFAEYRDWRNKGIAYDYCHINPRKGFTYEYTVPNKTLGHFARPKGEGGYCGDVKNGPFVAIGGDTENPHVIKRGIDGAVKMGNGVIAMHNVRAWLYEMLTGQAWPFAEHSFAWDDPKFYNVLPDGAPHRRRADPAASQSAISLHRT